MSSIEDFAAESLSAERSGAFEPYLAKTRPAAHLLVKKLLSSGGVPGSAGPLSAANTAGGAVLGFLARFAAPIFGANEIAAASLAPAAGAAGAAVSPLGALVVAAASLVDGKDKGGDAAVRHGRAYVTIHFRSVRPNDPAGRWTADMRIPVADDGTVVVRLRVPRQGRGTFHFCGTAMPISNGRAEFPLARLRANLSRGGVAFARPGSSPVPGAPFLEVPSP